MPITHAPSRPTPPAPPGPTGRRFLGSALEYRRDPTGFLTRLRDAYGDIAGFRLGPRRCCLVASPAEIERVLVTEARRFAKPPLLTTMGHLVFGHALTALDGAPWTRQRRMAAPAFQRERLDVLLRRVRPEIDDVFERLAAAPTPFDAPARIGEDELVALVLRVYARLLFGPSAAADGDVAAAVERALRGFGRRVQGGVPTPDWLPVAHNRDMRRGMRTVRSAVERALRTARDRDDTIAAALRGARDGDGAGYASAALRDELAVMWAVGAHQTAIGLAWALHLLATHPDAAAALAAEAGSADHELPWFTTAFVDEALRLYPPFPAIARTPLEAFDVGTYRVEAGTVLLMSAWVTHRDPRHFAEPASFRPERWMSDLAARLPRLAYFPFGAGARACIAGRLARAAIGHGLLAVVRRFRVETTPGAPVRPAAGVTLGMRGAVTLLPHGRGRSAA